MATVEELTAQAKEAQSEEDINAIEAQAEGRKGVADAVEAARLRLANQQLQASQSEQASQDKPNDQATSTQDAPSQGSAQSSGSQAAATAPGRHVGGAEPAAGGTIKRPTSVASAEEGAQIPDALGQMPEKRAAAPLDRTSVVEINGEQAAVPSADAEVGPHGLALPQAGEVGGGNIAKVLEAPPATDTLSRPMAKEQAAMMTQVGQRIAGLIARPVTEWGVIGPGETIRGHMLLLDMNTGEKVRAMDGHRVNQGELYVNLRNVPESLATGDTITRVLGAS